MKHPIVAVMVFAMPVYVAAAPEGRWELGVNKDSAGLALSSAKVLTLLDCRNGKGAITVTLHLKREVKVNAEGLIKTSLSIASGAAATTAPAVAYLNGAYGGTDVVAEIPATAPVLAAFARTGILKRTALGETSRDPPVPIAMAPHFLQACGG